MTGVWKEFSENEKPRASPGLSVSYEGGDSEFINYLNNILQVICVHFVFKL